MPTIQDIAPYINRNSISRSRTQEETEKGGPNTIDFDGLDEYISNLEGIVVEEKEKEKEEKEEEQASVAPAAPVAASAAPARKRGTRRK
jgi:hypothetical protein